MHKIDTYIPLNLGFQEIFPHEEFQKLVQQMIWCIRNALSTIASMPTAECTRSFCESSSLVGRRPPLLIQKNQELVHTK
jgi:hypothetical protein